MGCKSENTVAVLIVLTSLFFNYVGCKCSLKTSSKGGNISCSLTMWDVNCEKLITRGWKYRLFFNYVGCKWGAGIWTLLCMSCCSLTMWDVNLIDLFTQVANDVVVL